MYIIIPCAGQSTRFPNMRPKYLLCDYQGRSMLQLAAKPYLDDHTVYAIVLKEHDEQYHSTDQINSMFGNRVKVVVLPEPTAGPADTIYQALEHLNLHSSDGFLVRDCDSLLEHDPLSPGNKIFVDTLDNHPTLRMPGNKSYLTVNNWGIVGNIVEKKIISDTFCVGGYQFECIAEYKDAYNDLKNSKLGEIYMSSIVSYMITKHAIFNTEQVKSFVDLGTAEDWAQYNNKPTLFVDIDGTIVKNQALYGKNNYKTKPTALENNVRALLNAKARGAQIIFTTSRPSSSRTETQALLDQLGFGDCQLLMDLHHARRILINDHAATNPWPSAVAINIKRNDDSLDQMLRY